jgi:benzoyl-CoA-dihydrodiol lyase
MDDISFETDPGRYRHWKLDIREQVARLTLQVKEDAGLHPGYALKLNSYDLGVDIELADALNRLRFEHPQVGAVILSSASPKVFSAGANIYMLAQSSHPFKVNFCKFTNETRLAMEDASAHSGIKFIAALNGTASGGGYELALACDEILLVDDASSAVSLPEVALLGVLPGTGGLTRLTDKRRVRHDLADVFSTLPEGIKGKRAVEWGLVDAAIPRSRFEAAVDERALDLALRRTLTGGQSGVRLTPLAPEVRERSRDYRHVSLEVDAEKRLATLTVRGPTEPQPRTGAELEEAGDRAWALRAFRELDDALLHLRFNHPTVGTVILKTRGDPGVVHAVDEALAFERRHWLAREILGLQKRVLKRLDTTARCFYAVVDAESCFVGSLLELCLAADRSYMLDDAARPTTLATSAANTGLFPMANGLSRLSARFYGDEAKVQAVLTHTGPFTAREALAAGLVTFAPDAIDFDDELRVALEERAALSPDALTGMEASLRFGGPETMETKIFGRLSAWQNWIFTRPNATGDKGALTVYGKAGARPEFDMRRT